MTTTNKIIIALLTIIVIIAVAGLVMNYQKTEKKYQACLNKCEIGASKYKGTVYYTCTADCREKYGK